MNQSSWGRGTHVLLVISALMVLAVLTASESAAQSDEQDVSHLWGVRYKTLKDYFIQQSRQPAFDRCEFFAQEIMRNDPHGGFLADVGQLINDLEYKLAKDAAALDLVQDSDVSEQIYQELSTILPNPGWFMFGAEIMTYVIFPFLTIPGAVYDGLALSSMAVEGWQEITKDYAVGNGETRTAGQMLQELSWVLGALNQRVCCRCPEMSGFSLEAWCVNSTLPNFRKDTLSEVRESELCKQEASSE